MDFGSVSTDVVLETDQVKEWLGLTDEQIEREQTFDVIAPPPKSIKINTDLDFEEYDYVLFRFQEQPSPGGVLFRDTLTPEKRAAFDEYCKNFDDPESHFHA
jgi:hypothetical protein